MSKPERSIAETSIRPIEDAFHRLQTPATDEAGDENLTDGARVALFNAGFSHHEIAIAAADGWVTVTGAVRSEGERTNAETAIRALEGVAGVSNELSISGAANTATAGRRRPRLAEHLPALRIISTVRYCGLEAASVIAAMRAASSELDGFLSTRGLLPQKGIVVIYTNVQSETVTVELGYRVGEDIVATSEGPVRSAWAPSGAAFSTRPDGGVPGLLTGFAKLQSMAEDAGFRRPEFFWQMMSHLDDPWAPTDANREYVLLEPAGEAVSRSD
jgi:BON domain